MEEWGDHLLNQKQTDAALNHFIEAGQSLNTSVNYQPPSEDALTAAVEEELSVGRGDPRATCHRREAKRR